MDRNTRAFITQSTIIIPGKQIKVVNKSDNNRGKAIPVTGRGGP
jgi:hypothetical protein